MAAMCSVCEVSEFSESDMMVVVVQLEASECIPKALVEIENFL
jgi:RNA polymerase subunit RPABC4/transcription elongation factor Spt4